MTLIPSPSIAFGAFPTMCHSDNTQKHNLSFYTGLSLLTTSSQCFSLKEKFSPTYLLGEGSLTFHIWQRAKVAILKLVAMSLSPSW